jgi:hydroxymethylpyrimidine pyrophosphatase-like HAD family hydrolase
MRPYSEMLVSDLDGTLLFSGQVSDADVETLRLLGEQGVLRTVATGRAWASVKKVLAPEFPIDYLVFSSGAGIVDWKTGELLVCHNLAADQVTRATQVFLEHDLDFMIHDPIPEARPYFFRRGTATNPDFDARFAMHAAYGTPFQPHHLGRTASQVLGISPTHDPSHPYEALRLALPDLSVVRATSPIDGRSIWLEAFSPQASKSQGAQWVADRHAVKPENVLAVGNDYNDWDLLEWAGTALVLDNAPHAVKKAFAAVPAAGRQGVTHAVRRWRSV